MKTTNRFQDRSGVTLLELLFVVLIIGILAMVFLPALSRAKARSRQIDCVSQLRQIGIAHHSFAHEHQSHFPSQVSVREGGTLEILQTAAWPVPLDQWALPHFRALSNDLVDPKVLTCPSDNRLRAESFAKLHSENLSYFICVSSEYSRPEDVLCGDRNIRANTQIPIIRFSPDAFMLWTGEMHEYEGNILFAGGHVQRVDSMGLQRVFGTTARGVVLLPGDAATPSNTGPNSSPAGNNAGAGGGNAADSFERFFQSMSDSPKSGTSISPGSPSSAPNSGAASASSSSSRVDPAGMTRGRSASSVNPVPLSGQPETNRMELAARTSPGKTPSPSVSAAPTAPPENVRETRGGVIERIAAGERSFWWFVLIGIAVATVVAILVYRHDRRRMVRWTAPRRTVSYGIIAERRRRGRM